MEDRENSKEEHRDSNTEYHRGYSMQDHRECHRESNRDGQRDSNIKDHRESHRESNMEVFRDGIMEDNKGRHRRSQEEHGVTANRRSDKTEGRREMELSIGEHQVGQKLGICMKIAYINLNGQASKYWNEIEQVVMHENWDIIMFTETHWRGKFKGKKMGGYRKMVSNRECNSKKGGGLAIYWKEDIDVREWEGLGLENNICKERMWMSIQDKNNMHEYVIGLVYVATNKKAHDEWNDELYGILNAEMSVLDQLNKNVMIMGDFNGHVQWEGTSEENKNGKRVRNFTEEHNMDIVNLTEMCKGKWTWMRNNQKSIIDYVLTNENMTSVVSEMTVDDKGIWESFSDHNWIEVKIQCKPRERKTDIEGKWNIRDNTNWARYKEMLELKVKENMSVQDIAEIMKETAEETIGWRVKNKWKKNRRERKARRARNEAEKKWKRAVREDGSQDRVQECWAKYREKQLEVKDIVKKEKAEEHTRWIKKCINNKQKSQTQLWRLAKGMRREMYEINELITEEGRSISGSGLNEEVHRFMTKLGNPEKEEGSFRFRPQGRLKGTITRGIVMAELEAGIKELRNNKAYGFDMIPNEFLKESGPRLRLTLLTAYNKILEHKQPPQCWNEDRGVLLHKGKSKKKLDNYRGLSISSSIGKLFTRILRSRVNREVEKGNKLGEIQGAFREGRSLLENVFILAQLLERASIKKRKLYVTSIDLRKAFDMVDREHLLQVVDDELQDSNFTELLAMLYKNTKKKFKTAEGYTEWIEYAAGVKQGCILSPTLFTLFMKQLGDKLIESNLGVEIRENMKIPGLFFADDLILVTEKIVEIEKLVGIVRKFTDDRGMEINFTKSSIMVKGNKQLKENMGIEIRDNLKYLGLNYVGRGSIWKKQREIMKNKAISMSAKIVPLAKETVDCIGMTDMLWTGEALPSILYGTEVVVMTKETIASLEKQQNNIARQVLGVNRSINGNAVRSEMGWKSMEGHIYKRKMNFWGYLHQLDEHRWAKILLEESIRIRTEWYKECVAIRVELGILGKSRNMGIQQWKKYVNWKVKKWEDKQNKAAIEQCKSLRHYNKSFDGRREEYLDKIGWKVISKFRLGVPLIESRIEDNGKCRLCGEQLRDMNHIVINCNRAKNLRGAKSIAKIISTVRRQHSDINDDTLLRVLLMEKYYTISEALGEIWHTWSGPAAKPPDIIGRPGQ